MNQQDAEELVNRAVDRLVEEQSELLDLDVSERALAHHVAIYIAELVAPGLVVDIEYNRHGADPKRLHFGTPPPCDDPLVASTVFPDIIVHVRGTDEHNVLVLELKKRDRSLDFDQRKLLAFRSVLGYQNAAHLILGRNSKGGVLRELRWVDG